MSDDHAGMPEFPFPHGPQGTPPLDYARLRKQQPVCPVHLPPAGDNPWLDAGRDDVAWLVTGYDDIAKVSTGPFSTSVPGVRSRSVLLLEDPEHAHILKVVKPFFSPRGVRQWQGVIDSVVGESIDSLVHAGPPADLFSGFAEEVPRRVMFESLGLRGEDDQTVRGLLAKPHATADIYGRLGALTNAFEDYFAQAVTDPSRFADSPVLAEMLASRDAGHLSTEEVVHNSALLLFAGIDTTATALGAGLFHLFRHPEQLAACIADPQLWPLAVEEMVRYTMPISTPTTRIALQDIEIAGVTVRQGDSVLAHHASAGWDEKRYDAPEKFDINREPYPPLYFGRGPHYCLGAPLARLEMATALRTLFNRLPSLRPAIPLNEINWHLKTQSVLPEEFPVSWDENA